MGSVARAAGKRSGLPAVFLALAPALFLLPALFLSPAPAFGWWDTGHMLVAEIAYKNLTPEARRQVDRLVALEGDPRSNTFITAACWPDDLKREGVHPYDNWHYVDQPFSPDGTPTPAKIEAPNVIWAIQQCVSILKIQQAPDTEKARHLRFLIHFVGDIHQPLHCVSRFTQAFPNGDQGGNLFRIDGGPAKNLHAFWDSVGELYPDDPVRSLDPEGWKTVETLADSLAAEYPESAFHAPQDLDPNIWAHEGLALAKTVVYAGIQPGEKPSSQYRTRARQTARRQLALAGYRLARLLNATLAPTAPAAAPGSPTPSVRPSAGPAPQ